MEKIYLQLGSNKGDRANYLSTARSLIGQHIGPVIVCSDIYETSAWGVEDQDDFYNQVIEVSSYLQPFDLMRMLQKIEVIIGKDKEVHWGPRNIDIDILFYGSKVIKEEKLSIPHPEIGNRRFVLVPMAEIAPDFIHPIEQKTVNQLLKECKDQGLVNKIGEKSIVG